ncbi:MAG: calcium-binding protein [Microcystis aeruginosa Ma_MB_F_20061100_S19]|uniref:Cyclolysin n=1 Tax=Microcystis aeruginosa SPC777 TaxID=482300 RepID=S3JG72_MICAE|nr:calcium-binding protein [Microcystis aeruginosa]EPF24085.1 Cyclolysin [Microcystis aeruginosa SPC777]OCY12464.1 MAG: hemolysin [Microcystis aeruginosa CACIAM 03]TRU10747.1 MAG: calcium-binding protein [Microcystis aeruginosa Ma_MB_F_20061100_S19D]TRU14702.1 MAG: calcium-binding protein [Microcystis aeruginosa Ma_MB_F_20061100_S19]
MAVFFGTIFNDNIVGTIFNDTFIGSSGNDRFNGGSGFDTADYSNLRTFFAAPQSITILPTGGILKGSLGSDQLTSVERIIANPFASNNLIDASTSPAPSFIDVDLSTSRLTVGNVPFFGTLNFAVINFDDVSGTNQNDFIKGDRQSNRLRGNGGNDTFFGTLGNDTLDGGTGNDTANYRGLGRAITVKPTGIVEKSFNGGVDDTISIETIIADSLVGGNTIDSSTAAFGASLSINLSTGGASVFGPFPTINRTFLNFDDVIGTSGNDTIIGDFQANILNGSSGDDLIGGSDGNDTLVGGFGSDFLAGGNGANTFIYNSRFEGVDFIADFISIDRIHLRSSGFAGLSLGSLAASRYGEGNSLVAAAAAAFSAGASSSAAILSVGTAAGVQVWYTNNAFNTAVFGTGANLLATLSSTFTNLATVNQSNFSVIA